jgi:DNA segregation ATPase FtsK/SpoIIIE-like protein
MNILKKLRDFFSRVYSRLLLHLSKKELIIILSTAGAAVVTVVTVASVVAVKKHSSNTPLNKFDNGISVSGENVDVEAVDEDVDTADLPVVETATAGTKVESTSDTTVLAKKDDAKKGYMNRCVFLGDSRTVAMVNYGFFNDDAALAQIGISHPAFATNTFINNAGKEYTLKSYLESHQAPVIYIALGVNGINDPSEEHYKSTFISLIDKVAEMAPNSNIVLMAIGPVDDNGSYKKTVQNSWIDKYNEFLLDTAKEKHIFYLDISEILKGTDGQVKSEYNAGDGLHYSGSGCEAIFNYILEHPVPGIADDGEYVVKYIKPNPNRTKVTMNKGSGIDEDNLKDLMDMMMGGTSTDKSSSSVVDTQSLQQQKELEEAARRAEEERRAREKEEADRREQEAEEAAARKADEERRAKEKEEADRREQEAKRQAEEEAARKADEERRAREEADRKAAEEEAARKADEERRAKEKEEADRKAAEEEAARKAAEEEAARKASEEEAARKASEEAEEAARKASEEAEEAARKAAEEENQNTTEENDSP